MWRARQAGLPQARGGPGQGGDYAAPCREGERPGRRENPETRLTDRYSRDLTRLAAQGGLDPLIGRDREVGRVVQILARRGVEVAAHLLLNPGRQLGRVAGSQHTGGGGGAG